MKVLFDNTIKIAGIGLVPWTRLGPEQWLPGYAIASLHNWDLPANTPGTPTVYALDDRGPLPELNKFNTQHMLQTPEFQALLNNELAGYDLLTYRPVTPPTELKSHRFLMVDQTFTERYENKVVFRELFKDVVRFPDYKIFERSQLERSETFFGELLAGRSSIVLQDEQLSGGKGTFIISTYEEYAQALSSLDTLSEHSRVVVSSTVSGARERTIQACVTQQGVLVGPLQRQIVRQPLLASTEIVEGDKFCGAQILASDQQTDLHNQASSIAQRIGARLQAEGYRGIFGVDFLLGDDGELYTLEINPRITGVTPLLTALYEQEEGIPFYLLHLLELGGYEYEITDTSASFEQDGALLIVHSLEHEAVVPKQLPASGTYRMVDGELERVSDEIRLRHIQPGEFIVQEYVNSGVRVKPGGRLVNLQIAGSVIDKDTDELYNSTVAVIEAVRRRIATK